MGKLEASLRQQPNTALFVAVFAVWCLFFHVVGNSSFGYVNTPSLFGWLNGWYHLSTIEESGDELCPLIPFLVLLLFWLKRGEMLAVPKRVWLPGLFLVGIGVALHVAAFLVQQVRISGFAFVLGGLGLMALFWGPVFLRVAAFPWSLLVFAIPLDAYTSAATFPLRLLSTTLSAGFCRNVLGLKLVQQGTSVYQAAAAGAPGFNFDVVAACSGIRSAAVILLIALVHSYLHLRTFRARALVVLAAVPLAVIGNVVRLTIVFIVGDALGESMAKSIETRFGFITYGCALAGVVLLGNLLERKPARPNPPSPTAPDSPAEASS
jgi:exosortase